MSNSRDKIPPQVPVHNLQNEGIPTSMKPVNRSKTVRNLDSAGSIMKGLFNTKKTNKIKSDDTLTRPIFSTSASYGPTSVNAFFKHTYKDESGKMLSGQIIDDSIKPAAALSSLSESEMQHHLQKELDQLNELINVRQMEVESEKKAKGKLQNDLLEAQRIIKERETEYSAIEHSFFEHTRSIRATDDDLSTIRDSFKLLKYSIARLIMTLNKKADKARAAEKFCKTWPNLPILDPTTKEMEPSFVNLLAEKLVHEHLVRDVFGAPFYPGLKINDAYRTLNTWLQQHESNFSVRLRQQIAAVVAKSKTDSEIQRVSLKQKKEIGKKIYDDLADIYHPFLRENDAGCSEEKSYYNKICDIVDKALKLTIAIRGQEVEINTMPIEEGYKQEFDEEVMTEAKGKTTGLVRFCICPAFIGGDREHGFVEKGKVVVLN